MAILLFLLLLSLTGLTSQRAPAAWHLAPMRAAKQKWPPFSTSVATFAQRIFFKEQHPSRARWPYASARPQSDVLDLWSRLPKEILDAVEFAGVLGSGSFGTVVLCEKKTPDNAEDSLPLWADNCDITGNTLRCDSNSTYVAIKMIKPRAGEEALAMREGLVLATIASIEDSDLIAKCIDYGVHGGIVYIASEYLNGIPLDRVLAEEGPLSPKEVARVGVQVAEALSVVHRAGFVYRDLKPHNILRCADANGVAKYRLIDFGSAAGIQGCLFGAEEVASMRRFGWEAGTQELEADLLNLLNLGADDSLGAGGEPSCRIVEDGQETADRLAQVFQSFDDQDRGSLPAEDVSRCMEAVGIKHELAAPAAMTQDQFVRLFAQLVRRQDDETPCGTFS